MKRSLGFGGKRVIVTDVRNKIAVRKAAIIFCRCFFRAGRTVRLTPKSSHPKKAVSDKVNDRGGAIFAVNFTNHKNYPQLHRVSTVTKEDTTGTKRLSGQRMESTKITGTKGLTKKLVKKLTVEIRLKK